MGVPTENNRSVHYFSEDELTLEGLPAFLTILWSFNMQVSRLICTVLTLSRGFLPLLRLTGPKSDPVTQSDALTLELVKTLFKLELILG